MACYIHALSNCWQQLLFLVRYREKKLEKDREERWRKLDALKLEYYNDLKNSPTSATVNSTQTSSKSLDNSTASSDLKEATSGSS